MTECPRWRLINSHYINVPVLPDGTKIEWEHKETSRESGRTVRKLYAVPMLLNPQDPADHNHPGEIVVCHDVDGGHMVRGDYIFVGEPTPEMEPLNDEAQAISDSLRPKWEHPIDTLPVNGGMSNAEQAFMQNMMASFAKEIGASLPGNSVVSQAEYDALKERLTALEALIAKNAQPAPSVDAPRRV